MILQQGTNSQLCPTAPPHPRPLNHPLPLLGPNPPNSVQSQWSRNQALRFRYRVPRLHFFLLVGLDDSRAPATDVACKKVRMLKLFPSLPFLHQSLSHLLQGFLPQQQLRPNLWPLFPFVSENPFSPLLLRNRAVSATLFLPLPNAKIAASTACQRASILCSPPTSPRSIFKICSNPTRFADFSRP